MDRTIEEDIAAALENITDGGGTVMEHARLLAKDHGISVARASAKLIKALNEDEYLRDKDVEVGE